MSEPFLPQRALTEAREAGRLIERVMLIRFPPRLSGHAVQPKVILTQRGYERWKQRECAGNKRIREESPYHGEFLGEGKFEAFAVDLESLTVVRFEEGYL